jgi:hypothetical protein
MHIRIDPEIQNRSKMTIDGHELARLQSCERAWNSVFDLILTENRQAVHMGRSGIDGVLAEIKRLYAVERTKGG